LAVDPIESAASGFAFQVERFYAALIQAADGLPQVPHLRPGISVREAASGPEPGLGGKLLYAGKLEDEARALLVAANIAGAASLVSTANAAAGKQAIRDGVVDFLVTSLDEALRILKNEIRKRETAAVCVLLPPEAVEREMLERGVVPDLARPIELAVQMKALALLSWRVASSPVLWLPKLDAIALSCLDGNMGAPEPALSLPKICPEPVEERLDSETWDSARRWLRLAPRYLGRLARGVRLLRCDESTALDFLARVRGAVGRYDIGVSVEITLSRNGQPEHYSFAPPIR